jgi:hypothetical protein
MKKIGPKHHIFTTTSIPLGKPTREERDMKINALTLFPQNGASLHGRVAIQKQTKADRSMTQKVLSIAQNLPTPFNVK